MKSLNFFWILIVSFYFEPALAYDFKHFNITQKLEDLTSTTAGDNQINQQTMLSDLLTPKELKTYSYLPAQLTTAGVDWDNILKMILPFLLNQGADLTQNSLNDALNWNKEFGGKIKNYKNFEWQQPLGYLSLAARRDFEEVGPNRVEVNDILEITINASSYLKHLKSEKLINISNEDLNAFADVKYHRVYQYKHYKKSLKEAQAADFSTLLVPFQFFHFPDLLNIKPDEEISHKDYLSLKLSGSISANFFVWIKAGIDISGTFEHQAATVIKLGKNSFSENVYQMKKTTGTLVKLGIDAYIALDLFKLIDLTLIKISVNYEVLKTKTAFYQAPAYKIQNQNNDTSVIWQESALKTPDNPSQLSSYLVGKEQTASSSFTADGRFLIWGGSSTNEKKSEQIQTADENFNLIAQSWSHDNYVNSLFGGIVSDFLGDILSSFFGFSKKFAKHQEYSFYQNTETKEFQLEIRRTMYLDNRNSLWTLQKRNVMGSAITNHSLIPGEVKKLWTSKWLHKSVVLNDRFIFSHNILEEFEKLNFRDFALSAVYICGLSNNRAINLDSQTDLIHWNDLKWKEQKCVKKSYDKLKLAASETDNNKKIERLLDFFKIFLADSNDSRALFALFPTDVLSQQTQVLGKNKKNVTFKGSYNNNHNPPLNLSSHYLYTHNLWR